LKLFTGQPFPNDRILDSRISAAAKVLQAYYPEPNFGNGSADRLHFAGINWQNVGQSQPGNVSSIAKPWVQNFKVDHKLTDKDTIGYT
jgi:hypothetical protein